jgi:hypothetical protein
MNTPILSDEKQTHLAHVILSSLQGIPQAKMTGDSTHALREVKRVLAEHMKVEEDLVQKVRSRLQSYARQIPEGSQEWDVLYHKTYEEELRKRKLG